MPSAQSYSKDPADYRLLMDSLDQQLKTIARRLFEDVSENQSNPDGGAGFINYFLFDHTRKNLSESLLKSFGIDLKKIESLDGFEKLKQAAGRKYYRLVLEPYLDFTSPDSPRYYKLTVDGW